MSENVCIEHKKKLHIKLARSQRQMHIFIQCIHHSVMHGIKSIQPEDKAAEYLIEPFTVLLLIVSYNTHAHTHTHTHTHTSSRKVRWTGRNGMAVETWPQMTNHCNSNANQSKTGPSLCLPPSFCLPLPLRDIFCFCALLL